VIVAEEPLLMAR